MSEHISKILSLNVQENAENENKIMKFYLNNVSEICIFRFFLIDQKKKSLHNVNRSISETSYHYLKLLYLQNSVSSSYLVSTINIIFNQSFGHYLHMQANKFDRPLKEVSLKNVEFKIIKLLFYIFNFWRQLDGRFLFLIFLDLPSKW